MKMKLLAKVLNGPMVDVEVDHTDSILKVKQKLQELINISAHQQKVVYLGKTLSDRSTVTECGLQDGKKLFVVKQSGKSSGGDAGTNSLPVVKETTTDSAWWNELRRFLLRHFTPENAELVLQEYKKDLEKTMNSLNLDDIERFAKAKLTGSRMEPSETEVQR